MLPSKAKQRRQGLAKLTTRHVCQLFRAGFSRNKGR
jgi:hypothetical protein